MTDSLPPTVSVVMPLYNKAVTVERALRSILCQSHRDLEVIVVDDGSTDAGGEVVRRIADPKITLIVQQNAGPGAARNAAIAHATGTYLAFLDADDEWEPNYLARCLAILAERPDVAGISTRPILEPARFDRSRRWQKLGLEPGIQRLTPDFGPLRLIALLEFMSPCATIVRAEVLKRGHRFFTGGGCRYGEDTYLWIELLLTHSWFITYEPLMRVHAEDSGLSGNYCRARPIEPFLLSPIELYKLCPAELRTLLTLTFKIRALKTTCVLSYYGQWRLARALMARWIERDDWMLPLYHAALFASNPVGSAIGRLCRATGAFLVAYARIKGKVVLENQTATYNV